MSGKGLVFCGECKHFDHGYSDRVWETCAKAKSVKYRNHVGTWTERRRPALKNRANDCSDFKRRT